MTQVSAFTRTIYFTTLDCASCGVVFAVPNELYDRRREDGDGFYCPFGHRNVFRETEVIKLRRQLQATENQVKAKTELLESARASRDRAQRSASAYQGQVTKIKNRVKNGVCPCCNRSFQNLREHMRKQHPDWAPEKQCEHK